MAPTTQRTNANLPPTEETNTRRSARATKGQHKNLDALDQPLEAPKKRSGGSSKKGTAKAQAASEPATTADGDEGANDIIRCICGTTEQDDESDEMWIACNECDAWQHNVCVGAPMDPKVADEMDYWCEECRPENHKEYFDALKRGEKIWETRRHAYEEKLKAEKAKKSKKGKGRKSAGGDVRAGTPQSTKAATPAPAESNKKSTSTKRKSAEESHEGGVNKALKVSHQTQQSPTPATHNSAELTNAVKSLPADRQKPADSLNKAFVASLSALQKSDQLAGQNIEQLAQRFALELESATWGASINIKAYASQVRALFSNIKTNLELTTRILDNFGYIDTLARMAHADMATKKRQQEDEEMRARAEKQSIMVTEDNAGPRYRRTHKGEELVEYERSPTEEDSTRRRSMADPNHGMGARSREGTPGQWQNTAQEFDNRPSGDKIRQNATGQGNLSINTVGSPGRRQSMAQENFDINSVYSKVQTPVSAHHRTGSTASQSFAQQQAANVQDADVDRLLNDDDGDDYEPPDYQENDPSVVWRGTMTMTTVADFPAVARHVAGADLRISGAQYSDILEDRLSVAGRIDPGKAEEYLCSLRFSPSTDVCVIELSPTGGESAKKQFVRLYEHFEHKGKYGVLGSKTTERGNIRDTYLIPVAPGQPDRPEFLLNFQHNSLPTQRTEPVMIIAIVIRNSVKSPTDGDATKQCQEVTNRSLSLGGQGQPSMSPVVQQGSNFPSTPQSTQGQYGGGYNGQQQQQRRPSQGQDTGYNPNFPAQGMPPSNNNNQNNLPSLSNITNPALQQSNAGQPHNMSQPQTQPQTQSAMQAFAQQQRQGSTPSQPHPPNPNHNFVTASPGLPPQTTAAAHSAAVASARRILGPYAQCEVANFLMTQAHKMVEKEWWIIKEVFEACEEARHDVRVFSAELETRGPHTQEQAGDLGRTIPVENGAQGQGQQGQPQQTTQAQGEGQQNGGQAQQQNGAQQNGPPPTYQGMTTEQNGQANKDANTIVSPGRLPAAHGQAYGGYVAIGPAAAGAADGSPGDSQMSG